MSLLIDVFYDILKSVANFLGDVNYFYPLAELILSNKTHEKLRISLIF